MDSLFWGIALVVIGLIIAVHLAYLSKQEEAKQAAKQRYQQALHQSRTNPDAASSQNLAQARGKKYIELLEAERRQRIYNDQSPWQVDAELVRAKQQLVISRHQRNQGPTSYAEWQQQNQQQQ
ncbi:hypothetical protein [Herpetosiphon giganteus]|uniref:hypothetical protein n=1 Tax=Herpetosiphon giganteus TaxID=2029754 RepID=UPI001959253C|nr:hypothetical protein [Herpetosiphon giganteus]MBM7845481.1 hypothetical protein [Herpetosiphon giganteus]